MSENGENPNDEAKIYGNKLCDAIKALPCIYDPQAPGYGSREKLTAAWKNVASACNDTTTNCRFRWKTIRTAFTRSHKKFGANSNYYLCQSLQFLIPFLTEKKEEANNSVAEMRVETRKGKRSTPNRQKNDNNKKMENEQQQQHPKEININGNEQTTEKQNLTNRKNRRENNNEDDSLVMDVDKNDSWTIDNSVGESDISLQELPDNVPLGKLLVKRNSLARQRLLLKKLNKSYAGEEKVISLISSECDTKADDRKVKVPSHDVSVFAKPTMADKETMTDTTVGSEKNMGIQCNALPRSSNDEFLDSLKPQMKTMNSRQMLNFRRRIYQSLMEVLDDCTTFPNDKDIVEAAAAVDVTFQTATSSELKLMRELVALVHSAKTTPELAAECSQNEETIIDINNTTNCSSSTPSIKASTPSQAMPPVQSSTHDKGKQTVQSLTHDKGKQTAQSLTHDKGKQTAQSSVFVQTKPTTTIVNKKVVPALPNPIEKRLSIEKRLPPTSVSSTMSPFRNVVHQANTSSSQAPVSTSNSPLGIPRHIIQKSVKVAGLSTVMSQDGSKRRVYRIYPKNTSVNSSPKPLPITTATASNGPQSGTMFVTPAKTTDYRPNTTVHTKIQSIPSTSNVNRSHFLVSNTNGKAAPTQTLLKPMVPPHSTAQTVSQYSVLKKPNIVTSPVKTHDLTIPRRSNIIQRRYSICSSAAIESARVSAKPYDRPPVVNNPRPTTYQKVPQIPPQDELRHIVTHKLPSPPVAKHVLADPLQNTTTIRMSNCVSLNSAANNINPPSVPVKLIPAINDNCRPRIAETIDIPEAEPDLSTIRPDGYLSHAETSILEMASTIEADNFTSIFDNPIKEEVEFL